MPFCIMQNRIVGLYASTVGRRARRPSRFVFVRTGRPCVSMLFLAHSKRGCCVKSGMVFAMLSVNISVSGYQLDVKGLVAREMKLMVGSDTYTLVDANGVVWYTDNISAIYTRTLYS